MLVNVAKEMSGCLLIMRENMHFVLNTIFSILYRWCGFIQVQPLLLDLQWGQSEPLRVAGQPVALLQAVARFSGERIAEEGHGEGAFPWARWAEFALACDGETCGVEAQRLAHLSSVRACERIAGQRGSTSRPGHPLRWLRGHQSAAHLGGPERPLAPTLPGGPCSAGRWQAPHPEARPRVWRYQWWFVLQTAVLHRLPTDWLERLDHRTGGVLWELLWGQLSSVYGRCSGVRLLFPHRSGEPVSHERHKSWIGQFLLHTHQTQHHVNALLRRRVQHCQTWCA